MKPYFYLSSFLHAFILAGMIISATWLSKPQVKYFAVDLFAGAPAGGPAASEASSAQAPAADAEEEVAPPKRQELPSQESIRVKEKEKQKRPVPPAPVARTTPVKRPSISGALRSLSGSTGVGARSALSGAASGPGGAGGSSLVAETGGLAFPYPWYLKAIKDRLDEYWRPPDRFAQDTVCETTFVIARDGRVSGVELRRPSGDSYFDQLAVRAVRQADPMPPLPSGFPEDRLTVHMKFIGKP